MNVRQLIQELGHYDQDAEVQVPSGEGDWIIADDTYYTHESRRALEDTPVVRIY